MSKPPEYTQVFGLTPSRLSDYSLVKEHIDSSSKSLWDSADKFSANDCGNCRYRSREFFPIASFSPSRPFIGEGDTSDL